jgi:hypothetical protein
MASELDRTRLDARTRALLEDPSSCDSPRNAAAVAGGAWFGPIRWSVLRRAYAVVRD